MNKIRTIIPALGCIILLAAVGCNFEASCTICEGCTTITERALASDSVVFEQKLCSTRAPGQAFADSVTAIMQAHQSPLTTLTRYDTFFNCQYAHPKSKYAAQYEADGWRCELPK